MVMALCNPVSCFAYSEQQIIAMFEKTCAEMNVPLELAIAIAYTESRLNPYALNVAGASYYLSKEKAIQAAKQAQAAGKSFDVGLMQVNSQWLTKFKINIETAFNPAANIKLGVWILSQEIASHGLTWKAIARYHSPANERGLRYANLILKQLTQNDISQQFAIEHSGSPLKAFPNNSMTIHSQENYQEKQ